MASRSIPKTRPAPGPVNTVSNNSSRQTEGDLARAQAAKGSPTAWRIPFADVLDIETSLTKARCLVDVLSELCLPGGDMKAGEIALDQIGPEKLYSVLSILDEILAKVDDDFHTGLNSGSNERPEVAHAAV